MLERQYKHPLGVRFDEGLLPKAPTTNPFHVSDKNVKGTTTEEILYSSGKTSFTLKSAVNMLSSQAKKLKAHHIKAIARHFILSQNNCQCQNVLTFEEFKVFLGRIISEGMDMF